MLIKGFVNSWTILNIKKRETSRVNNTLILIFFLKFLDNIVTENTKDEYE